MCWYPQFSFQRSYQVQSLDEIDVADCWLLEVEWLAFHFEMAGGRFRRPQRENGQAK